MTRIAPEDYISSSNLTAYRSFLPQKDVTMILFVKKDGVSTTKEITFDIEAGKITYLYYDLKSGLISQKASDVVYIEPEPEDAEDSEIPAE